jgi:glycosyltransferase involved in cell wall biosynthesis
VYKNKRITLILPTYNEKNSIKKVINDFESLYIIDEILVINNNAIEGTSEEVAKTTAREIHEPIQGYGAAIRRGFSEASGDLIVVCEPDDTFLANDIYKLLAYSDDVEIIYGSRTVKSFIWKGANMGKFLKWGNYAVAKLMEILFNTNFLSDVGCTYRLITKNALKKIEPSFRVNSNFFGPEMMILGFLSHIPSVQISVNYKERVGKSSVTGDFWKALKLGVQMILLILAYRFKLDSAIIPLMERRK